MIVGRIVEEYGEFAGAYVRSDPVCQQWTGGDPGDQCGKPATVRRNHWPYWSHFWCPEHAHLFDEPHGPVGDLLLGGVDVPTFQRRAA